MPKRRWFRAGSVLFGVVLLAAPAAGADEPADALVARVKAAGREGTGNPAAARAWKELVGRGPDVLPALLAGLDDADPAAANWLRAAVDAVAERAVAAGRPLPAGKLEAFVRDTRHAGPARRLAYEWLARVDASAPDRLLPHMLRDPGAELRRDAVARALREAEAIHKQGNKAAATTAYRRALAGALDRDQVDECAKQLKSLGVDVDLAAHFGFIRQWQLLGPFDNRGDTGFDRAYPPEKGIDLAATYTGKDNAKLRWNPFTTADAYGLVDLNKAIGKHMGAVAYAVAFVEVPTERAVELRATSNNAVKIFLNGRMLFGREEYHHGVRMDQHVGRGTLKAGRNTVLIKVCQNEQKDDWAQSWSFQLRICDAVGAAVPMTVVTKREAKPREVQP